MDAEPQSLPILPPPKGTLLRRGAVQRFLNPFVRFLRTEAAGGIVLLACAATALALANSPFSESYAAFWHVHLSIGVDWLKIDRPLQWWVNDGLMTLFFLVVGLEIKREVVSGELRDPRKAALPAAAALGGMAVPALIYHLLRAGRPGADGWGIPMATDIAFVVGVLALLGPRVPAGLKILLLSLAIVDDLGAVLVIAVAYTGDIAFDALGLAGAGLLAYMLLQRIGIRSIVGYIVLGTLTWLAMVRSGVHPTLAGVALGLLAPASEKIGKAPLVRVMERVLKQLKADPSDDGMARFCGEARAVAEHAQASMAPLDRLQAALHPWVAFGVMPLFALANAGVAASFALLGHPVALAVVAGLLLGKPAGILLFSWLAERSGVARLPRGVDWRVMVGAGFLGGIGFTMSLFVASLALKGGLLAPGKAGTLAGSVASAAVGSLLLLAFLPARREGA